MYTLYIDGMLIEAERIEEAAAAAGSARATGGVLSASERGRAMYRLADSIEDRRDDLIQAVRESTGDKAPAAAKEVSAAIDRLACFAGWADKYSQILGGCNPVAGPYYCFSTRQPVGVVAVIAPRKPLLTGMITLLAPPLCAGNTIIAAAEAASDLPSSILAEACADAEFPAGALNIIAGRRSDLTISLAESDGVDATSATELPHVDKGRLSDILGSGAARLHVEKIREEQWYDPSVCESPQRIEPFVRMKTVLHPSAT